MTSPLPEPRAFLRHLFDEAVASADPMKGLAARLPAPPKGRCIVVGAGKSAALMARAVEAAWPDVPLSGLVTTRYGHGVPTERIRVAEASHPVPDRAGLKASREIMGLLSGLTEDDLVLALISGGGSALLSLPIEGVSLEDKINLNQKLLSSGLRISEMNAIRRRVSQVKGGGLAAAAAPAPVVTLAISDVPGDHPADIASGPTVPDPTAEADLSYSVGALGLPGPLAEKILRAQPLAPARAPDFRLIATPMMALQAAASAARRAGVTPVILGDALEGEAREMGRVMAGICQSARQHGHPGKPPLVLLSGGESTVTVGDGHGRGGRNTEFLLALAIAMDGAANCHAIACDTDGIDGSEDAAGAIIGPDSLARAEALGLAPAEFLQAHDSYSIFEKLDDLIKTGPTLTNVNDFRAILLL